MRAGFVRWLALGLAGTAAATAAPAFDYLGSDGPAALAKARCRSAAAGEAAILCKITEAWIGPARDVKRRLLGYMWEQRLDRTGRLPDSEDYERQKKEACQADPRDFYDFRGAFHKNYDAFLAEAKAAQAAICHSKDREAFERAIEARQKLADGVCEIEYFDSEVRLIREAPSRWRAKNAGRRHDWGCYAAEAMALACAGGAATDCELRIDFHRRDARWQRSLASEGKKACAEKPERKAITYSARGATAKPAHCRYLLDRYRDSECCAFEPK